MESNALPIAYGAYSQTLQIGSRPINGRRTKLQRVTRLVCSDGSQVVVLAAYQVDPSELVGARDRGLERVVVRMGTGCE